jgi:hypothetical protein
MTKRVDLRKPVFTIARGTVSGSGKTRWGVAVYEFENLSTGTTILRIDEFDFYIDPSVKVEILGKTLDYEEGRFQLI